MRPLILAALLTAGLAHAGDCIDFKNAGSAPVSIETWDTASKSGKRSFTIKPGYTSSCVCGPSACTVKVKGGASLDTSGKGQVTWANGKLTKG